MTFLIGPPGLNGEPGLPGDLGMFACLIFEKVNASMTLFPIAGLPGLSGQKGEPGK